MPRPVTASAKLPVFWGNAALQGLHIGLFIALAAAVVFWVLLNRTRLGYEVRALADRILVIFGGRISGEFAADASEEELGRAMTGTHFIPEEMRAS